MAETWAVNYTLKQHPGHHPTDYEIVYIFWTAGDNVGDAVYISTDGSNKRISFVDGSGNILIDWYGNDQTYIGSKIVTFETSLTGNLLTWLEANAEKKPTNITLDLSTIGLSVGTHSIQMKLSDDGVTRADSALSNAVSYVVPDPTPQMSTPANVTADGTTISFDEVENAEKYEVFADGTSIGEYEVPSGETWVINNSITSGLPNNISINFTSNSTNFQEILTTYEVLDDEYLLFYKILSAQATNVYNGSDWVDQDYRTVTFDTAPTGDLLIWLQANAVKQ